MLFLSWSFWEEVGETSGATTSTLGPPHLRAATSTLKLTLPWGCHIYPGAATDSEAATCTPGLLHLPRGCHIYPGAATNQGCHIYPRATTA